MGAELLHAVGRTHYEANSRFSQFYERAKNQSINPVNINYFVECDLVLSLFSGTSLSLSLFDAIL
jgi:hypothetical protein